MVLIDSDEDDEHLNTIFDEGCGLKTDCNENARQVGNSPSLHERNSDTFNLIYRFEGWDFIENLVLVGLGKRYIFVPFVDFLVSYLTASASCLNQLITTIVD